MIHSFIHKGLERYFLKGSSSGIKDDHNKRLRIILTFLNEAHELKDLDFPGSGLHKLKGRLKGRWSIKVSGNWRVVFKFSDGNVYDVDYLDYH